MKHFMSEFEGKLKTLAFPRSAESSRSEEPYDGRGGATTDYNLNKIRPAHFGDHRQSQP